MKKALLFLLISNFLCAQWSVTPAERNALIALYESTNGNNWVQKWDFAKDPKNWYGIKIKNGNVSEINLAGNGLSGVFPPSVSAFASLQKLDLSHNQISGEISPAAAVLTQLTRIDLSDNNFTGDPTNTLSSLVLLEDLSLGYNHFETNQLNAFLQNFPKLKVLNLANFGLTQIPNNVATLSHLESLNLSNNPISANFSSLQPLSSLRNLDFSGTQLTAIPSAFSSLTQLTSLNLSHNLFSNNYSAPLASLTKIEWLSLENNAMTSLPVEISGLHNLVHLNVSRNKISGGLSSLASLTNLEQIFLDYNLLETFPEELLPLQKLQMLSLIGNQISGEIPENSPAVLLLENNRFSLASIENFYDEHQTMADFTYSPQRYDQEKTVYALVGTQTTLDQSLSGSDFTFSWYKNLGELTPVTTQNYHINHVEETDFSVYTCEALYLKIKGEIPFQLSFFREPITLEDESLNTEEVIKSIKIYPNPTSDYLNIDTKNVKFETAHIFDLSGKKILTTSAKRIDVRNLPSGAYLISLKTTSETKTFKFLKH